MSSIGRAFEWVERFFSSLMNTFGHYINTKKRLLIPKQYTLLKRIMPFFYSNVTLQDGLRAYIGLSSVLVLSVLLAGYIPVQLMSKINVNNNTSVGTLVSIAVVLWTACVTFSLISIERLEVVNLGIRLKDILRVVMHGDRYLLYHFFVMLVIEIMLLIIAAWKNMASVCLVITFLEATNLMYVVFIVMRYNSRERALQSVLEDIYENTDERIELVEENIEARRLIGASWESARFYPLFFVTVLVFNIIYYIIKKILSFFIVLFLHVSRKKQEYLPESEFLIYQMCRNMDYNVPEDCIALEKTLEKIDQINFVRKRKIFVDCISLILQEADNERHVFEIIQRLYERVTTNKNGDLELRKAIIESILLSGQPRHIFLLNELERIKNKNICETDEKKISYWKYICFQERQFKVTLNKLPNICVFSIPSELSNEDCLELILDLACDNDTLDTDYLINVAI